MEDNIQANCESAARRCYGAPSHPQRAPQFSYVWAMPDSNTFNIPAIRGLVKYYLSQAAISVDPFARNKRWATYTNDLNSETAAEYHLEAREFLAQLIEQGIQADLVIFDPPYSPTQVKECYGGVGLKNDWIGGWREERNLMSQLLKPDGIAISCGWNSIGLGVQRGFRKELILLVCHGREHNDTIVTVERKVVSAQLSLISEAA
jgi:hypothetical protein